MGNIFIINIWSIIT